MANEKISQFSPLLTLASGDYFPVVDISEPSTADQNKRVGVDILDERYYAAASGVVALTTAISAQASGNAALVDASVALASGNAALELGGQALASGLAALQPSDIGVTVQGYDADTAKLDVIQTFTAVQTLTDPAIIGTILEDVYTIADGAAFEVDPGNGSVQLVTLGADRTPKATNFAAGESVTLMVDDGSARTLTWTDATWGSGGVAWTGGSAPTLATTGYTVIQFWKVSSQVYGALVGEVA